MNSEKRYSWLEILRDLYPFVANYRRSIIFALLLTGSAIAIDLIEPVIYKHVMNDLAGIFVHKALDPGEDADPSEIEEYLANTLESHGKGKVAQRTVDQGLSTFLIAAVLLLFVNLVSHALSLWSDYISNRYSSRLEQDFIAKLYEHVLRLKLSFLSRRSSPALAKQIDQTDSIGPAVTAIVQEISAQFVRVIGAVGIMLYQNVILSLIALAVLPVYFILARAMANRLELSSESYYEGWDDVSERLISAISNIKTVKVSGAESRVAGEFRKSLRQVNDVFLSRTKSESYFIFAQSAVIQFGKFLVLAIGSWKVIEHQLTPGDVVMFVALLDKLFDPIDELASHLANLQNEKTSISRGLRLMHARSVEPHGADHQFVDGKVEFRGIRFSYRKDSPVLNDLNLILRPGEMTALVGPSGSGKTTLSDLLLRFYEVDDGEILVDGLNISKLDPASIRRQIGTVLADGAIFHGTLRDNLAFRCPEASKGDIQRAVEVSGLSQTVARLPRGLKTEVGEDGLGLSVGERQRVQIARLLVAVPKILILDEATANLDYSTEQEIRRTLRELRGRSTILTIAHRPSMVQDADRVAVLTGGRIVAYGTIDEVRRQNEWFAHMMNQSQESLHHVET